MGSTAGVRAARLVTSAVAATVVALALSGCVSSSNSYDAIDKAPLIQLLPTAAEIAKATGKSVTPEGRPFLIKGGRAEPVSVAGMNGCDAAITRWLSSWSADTLIEQFSGRHQLVIGAARFANSSAAWKFTASVNSVIAVCPSGTKSGVGVATAPSAVGFRYHGGTLMYLHRDQVIVVVQELGASDSELAAEVGAADSHLKSLSEPAAT